MVQPRFVLTISMMSIFMTILSHQMQSPEDLQNLQKYTCAGLIFQ